MSDKCYRPYRWRSTRRMILGGLEVLTLCQETLADNEALADPTRPVFATPEKTHESVPAAPTPLHLQSTLTGPERRLAVIDGQVVSEGMRLGQFEVTEILAGQVLLRFGEARLLLKLPNASVRPLIKEETRP